MEKKITQLIVDRMAGDKVIAVDARGFYKKACVHRKPTYRNGRWYVQIKGMTVPITGFRRATADLVLFLTPRSEEPYAADDSTIFQRVEKFKALLEKEEAL